MLHNPEQQFASDSAAENQFGSPALLTVTELIARAGGELTPTERRIAEVLVSEPTLLAFGTVSDLANRIGTSRPSIVRFANKLGFDGYASLRLWPGGESRTTSPARVTASGATPPRGPRRSTSSSKGSNRPQPRWREVRYGPSPSGLRPQGRSGSSRGRPHWPVPTHCAAASQ